MALGRLSRVKDILNIATATTTFDDSLKLCLGATTQQIEGYTERKLDAFTTTAERYSILRPTNRLYTREWPIISITTVKAWNGSTWDTLTSTTYEVLDSRYILYPAVGQETLALYGFWPMGEGWVELAYTAGYVTSGWATLAVADTAAWISGHAYSINDTSVDVGITYICILAVTSATHPASDATHWTAIAFTVPADLEDACIQLAALSFQKSRNDHASLGMSSISRSDVSYSMLPPTDIPPDIKTILDAYVRIEL